MCDARVLLNDERDGQGHRIDDLRVLLREGEKRSQQFTMLESYDESTQGNAGIVSIWMEWVRYIDTAGDAEFGNVGFGSRLAVTRGGFPDEQESTQST